MPKKRRKMKNKEQTLEDKIKKIKEGCGFQNSYKQICGKTPKKKTDKRDKYLIYLCMRCMSKMGIIQRQINLIQEGKKIVSQNKAEDYCGNERPARKTLCQLKKGHKESHRAVIFWEGERK
jgi:hypothetical protein